MLLQKSFFCRKDNSISASESSVVFVVVGIGVLCLCGMKSELLDKSRVAVGFSKVLT